MVRSGSTGSRSNIDATGTAASFRLPIGLALDAGITPWRFALGVAAAVEMPPALKGSAERLKGLWLAADEPPGRKSQLVNLITHAQGKLQRGEY